MPLPIYVLPAADLDIDEAFYYWEAKHSPETAQSFMDGVQSSLARLQQMPEIGNLRTESEGLRQWPVKNFEIYLIFYRITDTAIEIIRVLHGKRDLTALLDTIN